MQQSYRAADLAPDQRIAMEQLLGRALHGDETIELILRDRESASQETERRKSAAARIRKLAVGKSLGGSSIRELIEEGRRL
jgi:hypothetical protein